MIYSTTELLSALKVELFRIYLYLKANSNRQAKAHSGTRVIKIKKTNGPDLRNFELQSVNFSSRIPTHNKHDVNTMNTMQCVTMRHSSQLVTNRALIMVPGIA